MAAKLPSVARLSVTAPRLARHKLDDEPWRDWRVLRPLQTQRCLTTLTSGRLNSRLQGNGPPNAASRPRYLSTTLIHWQETSAFQKKLLEIDNKGRRFKDFELDNRVFIVTGGGRGLGLELAEALVEAGGHVYCLDRLPEPHTDFQDAQENIPTAARGSLHYERVDVRDGFDVEEVIGRVAGKHERLDGLIAAAGVQKVTPALDYPSSAINEMMDINYRGVYISAVSCARQMIKHKTPGSILLIGSMSGLIANKGFTSSVYNSSKAAVIQLARSLAMEWGQVIPPKDGKGPNLPIRVNALCPGNIVTPMVQKNFEDDPGLEGLWKRENMMGRLSTPKEYRGAALFCLSDASSFMTGSHLVIDGGYTAW